MFAPKKHTVYSVEGYETLLMLASSFKFIAGAFYTKRSRDASGEIHENSNEDFSRKQRSDRSHDRSLGDHDSYPSGVFENIRASVTGNKTV